jgi:hypothetical protein
MIKNKSALALVLGIGLLIATLSVTHKLKAPKYKTGDCVMLVAVTEEGGPDSSYTPTLTYVIKGVTTAPGRVLPKELRNTRFYQVGVLEFESNATSTGWMVPVTDLDGLQYATQVTAGSQKGGPLDECNPL